jgi:hypothetical protein
MNPKSSATFILGVVGTVFLFISKINGYFALFSYISTASTLIGSLLGLWFVISLIFKNITLSSRDKNLLLIGTIICLVSYSLGRFGIFIIFWLPTAILCLIAFKVFINSLNKVTSSIMNPLQDKVNQMEAQLEQNRSTSPK